MHRFMLIAALAFSLAGVVSRTDGAGAADPEAFRIGKVRVWAIADNTGEPDMSVFVADADVIKEYAPTGTSPSGVLCFLLESDDGLVLVDTGNGNAPSHQRPSLLLDGLRRIKIDPAKIDAVLVTHMHGDHIGGLAWEGKPAFPNAKVMVGRVEHDFWTSADSRERFPNRKANFDKVDEVLGLYGDKVEIFDFGVEVVPGVTSLDSRGHTPGHTAFLLESDGEQLLCIGDLVHSAALQFPRPDINSTYDMAPAFARAARREFLSRAAWENIPIAGMHLPFPGVGRVSEDPPSGYTYTPGL